MYYIFTSRYQPLTLLVEQEMLWLSRHIKHDDRIILGIVLPDPNKVNENDYHDHWVESSREFNPLTYWERHKILLNFIRKHHLDNVVEAVIPLSRPSQNMREAIPYLPNDRMMCVPVIHDDEIEEQRIMGLLHQNESCFQIRANEYRTEFPKELCMISQELVYCFIALDDDRWVNFVSNDVATYLKHLSIADRLKIGKGAAILSTDIALTKINKIYNRTADEDEKMELYWLLAKYLRELFDSGITSTADAQIGDIDALVDSLSILISQIEYELPVLKRDAPYQYKKFSRTLKFSKNLRNRISSSQGIDKETFAGFRNCFERMRVDWEKRKK